MRRPKLRQDLTFLPVLWVNPTELCSVLDAHLPSKPGVKLEVMMSEALPSRIPVGVVAPEVLTASLSGSKLLLSRRALAAGRGDRSAVLWLGESISVPFVTDSELAADHDERALYTANATIMKYFGRELAGTGYIALQMSMHS